MNTITRNPSAWLPTVANAAAFNLVWFVTVFGAAQGLAWAGPAALLGFAAIQLSLAARPRYDVAAMLVFASAGLVIDSAWSLAGLAQYTAGWPDPALAPIWLVSLWAAFALTIGHSLAWIRPRPFLAGGFGALGGGVSYWVGARVGAVELAVPTWQYATVVGTSWAVALPLLIRVTTIVAGYRLPAYQR